ncbi:aminoacyl-histidine dipeptidase [Anaerosphaera multitolerans]|uniref:Cytosol non-specific dipeptidase n=1 Tax=Anaerosphaera multitolerans TaxID=2487351 RepID=A0A437S4C2_9FIRM|nr:aminoacyl-histidine dipeptidase [Anaerosphaera multitolerans]RVU53859.1 aminoacyl-histidine dipeptidase [Anaerosphaera multitolerans]
MSLNIEPKEVFNWFYELNQIPRESGNEKEVSDFLVAFAKDRNLEVIQDEEYNVIIKKPGTEGYENSQTVIIQGHMDMVCVKTENSNHNFDTDPIEMVVDGEFLRAKDTTLGADDGIAVAYALAILDSDDLSHPPLEVLITTNEETGMDGAAAIKDGMLKGTRLLNIDSEEEGIFLVSCAGGATAEVEFKIEREDFKGEVLEISVKGLLGGHSGSEIIRQRANANKLMGRILNEIRKAAQIRIISITGGIKHNAIPSDAKVKIVVDNGEKVKEIVKEFEKQLKAEYRVEDGGLTVIIEDAQYSKPYTEQLTSNFIDYSVVIPDGVISMSKDIDGLVETSLNNAVIEEFEDVLKYTTSVRSSSASELQYVLNVLEIAAEKCRGSFEITNSYPAWQFEEESEVRDKALQTYKDLFGEEATYDAIHAGLECGLLKGVLPDCDMISYGPNIFDAHSPTERMEIKSAQKMWKFTKELLKNLK